MEGTTGKNQSKAIKPLSGLTGTGVGLIGSGLEWETLVGPGPAAPPESQVPPPTFNTPTQAPLNVLQKPSAGR